MTDSDNHFEGLRGEPTGEGQHGGTAAGEGDRASRARRRAIGTPPPALARRLLGDGRAAERAEKPELPAEPANAQRARRAEQIAALCFAISFLGSVAFIAAYVIFQVHTLDDTFRSNLALGGSMTVAFLAIAVGAVIWVRELMPQVELTEERHPLASAQEDRQAFERTFAEGAQASQVVKRPLLRRIVLLDLGPLPRARLRHTAWKKGTRLVVYGTNEPVRAADFSSPGSLITVVPEGTADDLEALAKAATIIIKYQPGELRR